MDRGEDEPQAGDPAPDAPPAPDGPDPRPATPPAQAAPLVSWAPAPPEQPEDGFSIGGLLSEAFARYGDDPVRIYLLSAVPAVLGFALGYFAMGAATLSTLVGTTVFVGLLSGALGLVGTGATFVVLERGRSTTLLAAVGAGAGRIGWLFAASFTIGILVGLIGLVAYLAGALVEPTLPALAGLIVLVGVVIAVWLGLRLILAMPATVVDELRVNPALRRAWSVSRPAGIWLRLLGAGIVLALLLLPAAMGAGMLSFLVPASSPWVALAGSLALAFLTPLSSILLYTAYRRLAPRPAVAAPPPAEALAGEARPPDVSLAGALESTEPPAVEPPTAEPPAGELPPTEAGQPPTAPSPVPAFAPRPLGTRGKAILGISLAMSLAGLVTVPLTFGRYMEAVLAGAYGLPPDGGLATSPRSVVPPGEVQFGTAADLGTCSIVAPTSQARTSDRIAWLATLTERTSAADEIVLRVVVDGRDESSQPVPSGVYDCIGLQQPVSGVAAGNYDFIITVNGLQSARGLLIVR